jgi:hypothetical protein
VACQRGKVKVRNPTYVLRGKRLFSCIHVVMLILKA